jgi:hypothetical protein
LQLFQYAPVKWVEAERHWGMFRGCGTGVLGGGLRLKLH